MFNIDNNTNLIGRIESRDLSKGLFKNKDGSRKMCFTLAVQDNYRGADGQYGKQDIPVEAFIPKNMVKVDEATGEENYGIYSTLRTGDLIAVSARLMSNNYEKDGKMVYDGIVVRIDQVKHLETRTASEARAQQKAAAAAVAE